MADAPGSLEGFKTLNMITAVAALSLEWQSPLKIVLYPDPRLRGQNARIGTFDDNLRRFAEELLAVMYNAWASYTRFSAGSWLLCWQDTSAGSQKTVISLLNVGNLFWQYKHECLLSCFPSLSSSLLGCRLSKIGIECSLEEMWTIASCICRAQTLIYTVYVLYRYFLECNRAQR